MAIAVLLILLVGIVLFVTEIIPLPVTAMSMCVAFYLTGAVDASTALAAFSSGTAMIIVCMAIVGEAVFKTGGAAKIAHVLTKFADSERKLMFVTVLFSGLMSGFLSNTGAAGLLIALILGISLSTGMKRSKLMYPVIVGCCFGGGLCSGFLSGLCRHHLRPLSEGSSGGPGNRYDLQLLRVGTPVSDFAGGLRHLYGHYRLQAAARCAQQRGQL